METVLHWYLVGLVVNILVVYVSYLYDTFTRRTYKLRKERLFFILAIVMSWTFYIVLLVNGVYSLMLKVKR